MNDMIRKSSFVFVLAVALGCMSCSNVSRMVAATGMSESGTPITQARPAKYFSSIEISGPFKVLFEQSNTQSVEVEGPSQHVGRVSTEVSGTRLVIAVAKDGFLNSGDGLDNVTVHVKSPDLISVVLRGSGDFVVQRPLDTDKLQLSLLGSGDITFSSIVCDEIVSVLQGSGDVRLGDVRGANAQFSLQGSGEMRANLNHVTTTRATLTGSGEMYLAFSGCGTAKCDLLGSGEMSLSGTVSSLEKNVRGTGEIETDKLRVGKQ